MKSGTNLLSFNIKTHISVVQSYMMIGLITSLKIIFNTNYN